MAKILIPIPQQDFDPTEVAVTWRILSALGHDIVFATPEGRPGVADDMMLTGQGLDLWGAIPGLRTLPAFGLALRANKDARNAYAAMQASRAFDTPIEWSAIDPDTYDGLVLPGGHRARGMRAYLESQVLQAAVVRFFAAQKPVGAICHGVLLAARSIQPETGRSVLYGRRTTALTWELERSAWSLARVVRFWDPDYYRTYPDGIGQPRGFMSVQQEVTRMLAQPSDFMDVPVSDPDYRRKTSGLARDTMADERPAFVVRDGRYVSARWPGDVHRFATEFGKVLREAAGGATASRKISATHAVQGSPAAD